MKTTRLASDFCDNSQQKFFVGLYDEDGNFFQKPLDTAAQEVGIPKQTSEMGKSTSLTLTRNSAIKLES